VTFVTLVAMFLLKPPQKDANTPYPRLQAAVRQDRILIVAPHIDDESIGAGGYAIDAMANGAEVYVVFLTAGDCNRFTARLMNKTLGPTASNYLTVGRSEEHTSELQSLRHLVCRLLLEKKKKRNNSIL